MSVLGYGARVTFLVGQGKMMGVLGPGTRVTFLVRHGRGGILPGPRNIFKPEHNKQGAKAMNAVVVAALQKRCGSNSSYHS